MGVGMTASGNSPRKEDLNALLDAQIGDVDAELGERRNGSGANDGVLEDDAVVDVADVLARLRRLGTFDTEEVEDADGELGEFAVLDELAKLGESCR